MVPMNEKPERQIESQPKGSRIVAEVQRQIVMSGEDRATQQIGCHNDNSGGGHNDNYLVVSAGSLLSNRPRNFIEVSGLFNYAKTKTTL